MSSYSFTNKEGREVRYGLDKPTGGYFYNEFYTDDEIECDEFLPETKQFSEALTLSELEKALMSQFNFAFTDGILEKLSLDWVESPWPNSLQHSVNSMFGKNLQSMLIRVQEDLEKIAKSYK